MTGLAPTRRDLIVLAIVAIAGLTCVAYPFEGDQALYALGAKSVAHGAVLYRDFWDLKQPAIYAFYLVGGAPFGFHDVAVHVFELLYWLAFSAVLQVVLRGAVDDPRLASHAPLFVVVPYYAGSTPGDLTQVEPLAGFSLFVAWACAVAFPDGRARRALAFVAGLAVGIVLLWKLLFVIVLVAIGVAVAALRPRQATLDAPSLLAFGAGALVPLGAFAGYAFANHEAALVANTFVGIPAQIAREIPAGPPTRLLWSAREFVRLDLLVVVLAAIGAVRALGERSLRWRTGALAWLAAALVVVLIQRQSWWTHHFMLMLAPLGVLALFGLEVVARAVRGDVRKIALACALAVVLAVPVAVSAGRNVVRLAAHGFAVTADQRLAYQAASSAQAAEGIAAAEYLASSTALPGDIYVAGNPTVYAYAGRGQAVALNGWSLEFFVDGQWQQLEAELAAARPPYIYVSDVYRGFLPQAAPALYAWLSANYRAVWDRPAGTWFRRD